MPCQLKARMCIEPCEPLPEVKALAACAQVAREDLRASQRQDGAHRPGLFLLGEDL
jgi:hypothetical protein